MGTVLAVAILVLAALSLIFAEFFIPSFGMLTVCACALYGWALYLGWDNPLIRWTTIAATVPLLGLEVFLAVKLLPRSPFILRSPPSAQEREGELAELVGRTGRATTELRPAGKVDVGGQRLDAVSARGWTEKGSAVRVTRVAGGQVVVEPYDEDSANP